MAAVPFVAVPEFQRRASAHTKAIPKTMLAAVV
jgi:hypothetical protein